VVPNIDANDAYVIGVDGVGVFEILSNSKKLSQGEWWSIDNVRATFITADDHIDLNTGEVTFAKWKTVMSGHEHFEFAENSSDIFSSNRANDGEFLRIATRLFNSRRDLEAYGFSSEQEPVVYSMQLSREVGTAVRGSHPISGRQFISYRDLQVSVRPSASHKSPGNSVYKSLPTTQQHGDDSSESSGK
jgi:hypothetical protein